VLNDNKAFHRPVMYKNIPYLIAPLFIYSADKVTCEYDGKIHEVKARQVCYAQNVLFTSASNNFSAVLSDNVVLQFIEPSKFHITEYYQEPYKELMIRREPSSSKFHGYLAYGTLCIGIPELHPASSITIEARNGYVNCLGGRAVIKVVEDLTYIEVFSGTFTFSNARDPSTPVVSLTDGMVCLVDPVGVHSFVNMEDFNQNSTHLLHFSKPRRDAVQQLWDNDIVIRRENFFFINNLQDFTYVNAISPPPIEVSPSQK
jgi:hypothetical protein